MSRVGWSEMGDEGGEGGAEGFEFVLEGGDFRFKGLEFFGEVLVFEVRKCAAGRF